MKPQGILREIRDALCANTFLERGNPPRVQCHKRRAHLIHCADADLIRGAVLESLENVTRVTAADLLGIVLTLIRAVLHVLDEILLNGLIAVVDGPI